MAFPVVRILTPEKGVSQKFHGVSMQSHPVSWVPCSSGSGGFHGGRAAAAKHEAFG